MVEGGILPNPLRLDDLRVLLSLAETGNFTRTAERLASTQSTVSTKIKRLEERLTCKLFERHGQVAKLTGAGSVLTGYAEKMLGIHQEIDRYFAAEHPTGVVRIGVPESFSVTYMPPILGDFKKFYPDVKLEVFHGTQHELTQKVYSGKLDLALAVKSAENRNDGPIWKVRLHFVSHTDIINLKEPLPLALLPLPCAYRQIALPILEAKGIVYREAFVSPSMLALQQAAKIGLGVAILPEILVTPELIKLDKVITPLPSVEFAMYKSPSGLSQAAKALLEFLVTRLAEHA